MSHERRLVTSQCTGLTAYWCPVHGDCTCVRLWDGDCAFDGADCPLHGDLSTHPESVELDLCREKIQAIAAELAVELTDHDEVELSRFALWLHKKAAQGKGQP